MSVLTGGDYENGVSMTAYAFVASLVVLGKVHTSGKVKTRWLPSEHATATTPCALSRPAT